jgi:hypothetical protein
VEFKYHILSTDRMIKEGAVNVHVQIFIEKNIKKANPH